VGVTVLISRREAGASPHTGTTAHGTNLLIGIPFRAVSQRSDLAKLPGMQYIRYVPNIQNTASIKGSQLFIEDMARLLMPWGVPQVAARLYGYLLLRGMPTSLDQITVDLEISKSSASVAARLLEKYTLARRHGESGTKRAWYAVSENYQGILNEQKRMLHAMADLLQTGARTAASEAAAQRLEVMSEFYETILAGMESALQKWGKRKSR
jgi:DNA-binding transcriptional regulator GbsR (MarR family)